MQHGTLVLHFHQIKKSTDLAELAALSGAAASTVSNPVLSPTL